MDRLKPAGALICALLLITLAAAIAAACGDDDDDSGDDTSAATITVTTTGDADERDGQISLREAVLLAAGHLAPVDLDEDETALLEGTPGGGSADLIAFDLGDGSTIALGQGLPSFGGNHDTIDAGGQEVTIDGSAAAFTCLQIAASDVSVYGLWFVGCQTAVEILQGAGRNKIGGPGADQGNVFVDGVIGIKVSGLQNEIKGNHFGVAPGDDEPRGNEFEGIWLDGPARDNVIGGPAAGDRNIISGNPLYGISVDGARGTIIQGNYIGLDTSGRVGVANKIGITIQAGAFNTLVGGAEAGQGNVISANLSGITLIGPETSGNTIQGNLFGTSAGQGEGIPNTENIYQEPGVGENEIVGNDEDG